MGVATDVLARARRGALATVSPTGMAVGTILPLAIDEASAPYFALHAWGEHAQHLARDDRASVLIVDPESSDGPSPVRVTLVGRAHPVAGGAAAAARAAIGASEQHQIYRLDVSRLRVAAGPRAAWLSPPAGA